MQNLLEYGPFVWNVGVQDAFRQVDNTINDMDRQLRLIESDIRGSEEYVREQIQELIGDIQEQFDEINRRITEANQTAVDVDLKVEDNVFAAAPDLFWSILENMERENEYEVPNKEYLRLYFHTIERRLEMLEKAVHGGTFTMPDDSGD